MKSEKEHSPGVEDMRSIAESAAGKQLLELMRNDQDPAVQAAIRQAKNGDFSLGVAPANVLLYEPDREESAAL